MKLLFSTITITLFSLVMTAQSTVKEKNEALEISDLEIPPIISGCNPKKSKEKIRACLNKKFKARLNRRLQLKVFNSKNMSVGKHVIKTVFKISSEGDIIDINVAHNNPKIVTEIERALGTFKKFKPGLQNGKPVNVTYGFPLNIVIFK